MDDDWLSLQQGAGALGLAYRTALAMVRWGELPAEKPEGTPYRILRRRALRATPDKHSAEV